MDKALIIAAILVGSLHAQIVQQVVGSSRAQMPPIIRIDHQTCQNSSTCMITLNITAASLEVCVESAYGMITSPTSSNSWNAISTWPSGTCGQTGFCGGPSGTAAELQTFYVYNPSGTSDTITMNGQFMSAMCNSYSGTLGTSGVVDVLNGNSDSTCGSVTGTIQPGSITPGVSGELLLTTTGALAGGGGISNMSIGSGFTIVDALMFVGSTAEPGADADLVDSSTSPINPTWNWGNMAQAGCTATIVAFKHS